LVNGKSRCLGQIDGIVRVRSSPLKLQQSNMRPIRTHAKILVAALAILAPSVAFAQENLEQDFGLSSSDSTSSFNLPVQKQAVVENKHPELAILRSASDAYRKGDFSGGDKIAQNLTMPTMQIAAEWIALRTASRPGFDRLNAFITKNPELPVVGLLTKRAEEALYLERASSKKVLQFFESRKPETSAGRAILANAKASAGETSAAAHLALTAYRDRKTTRDVAENIEKAFPDVITAEQKALRAHMLILNNMRGEGVRLASTLGGDHTKLAQALAFASNKGSAMQPLDDVPGELRDHASFRLAKAQVLRRQDKLDDARDQFFKTMPRGDALADSDEIWTERRVLARRLLDANDAAGAYRVVAEHSAKSIGRFAEAEFHAGWIALRYLNYPQTALLHFEKSASIAELTTAKSRAAYWRGRAVEAGAIDGNSNTAVSYFTTASQYPTTYYGQLAAAKLGNSALALPAVEATNADDAEFLKTPAGQLLQTLLDAGLQEYAMPVAMEFAKTGQSATHLDSAIRKFLPFNNAAAILALGRTATARGLPLEHHAFPTFGIPSYQPLPGSGEKAMVYAIARQESAFQTNAVSHANARGLMQMLPSTASRTARRFKVAFSPNRLTEDPAFCAQLGAAHLGELMEETKGSLVMTFASYNAGGGRVREWIAAAGDPRQPGVDVVDWVERIPFYETRNYVMKIMENLQVYRARMQGNQSALLITQDMETGRRR
jgi:soluble lytic murein transglycosylase